MKQNMKLHYAKSFVLALLMGFVFSLIGYLFNQKYPILQPKLLQATSVVIGVVWASSLHVYTKLIEVTDAEQLTYKEHERLEHFVHQRLNWFWLKAFAIGVLGLVVSLPAIYQDATDNAFVPAFLIYLGYASLGVACYMLARLLLIQEEIRAYQSALKQEWRKEQARKEIIHRISESDSN